MKRDEATQVQPTIDRLRKKEVAESEIMRAGKIFRFGFRGTLTMKVLLILMLAFVGAAEAGYTFDTAMQMSLAFIIIFLVYKAIDLIIRACIRVWDYLKDGLNDANHWKK